MMVTEILLVRFSSLFIFLLFFSQTCCCMNNHICTPSSCGNIDNISFPFRLKNDPKHCGYPDYELECENNVSFLYLNSQKYRVKAINYTNLTIRLVDVSINNSTFCFPNSSVYQYNFTRGPYSTHESYLSFRHHRYYNFPDVASPINFMSCPHPLNSSSFLTELTNNSANGARHTYIKVGHMNASEVKYMCRIDLIVMTSWKFKDLKNVSVSEIHDSLLYGFELSWFNYPCSKCKDTLSCSVDENHTATCYDGRPIELPQIVVIIIVLLVAGIFLGNSLIIGFAVFLGVSFLVSWKWYFTVYNFAVGLVSVQETIGIILIGIRFVIVLPGIVWLLFYKFRRRHLSMFNEIEDFLQSENNLMPIRYSYSDIKKMTRGFREKLGQGGYGIVYKGKLRSGYDVAIKILAKPGGNDQDFMNEIATIGRIHHVNVINLVGYCAERSKRALVFDFMPNASLDKYIYSREKVKCLSWEKKYEIAVGVARGIEYLHKGCDIQILHFDIKPHNILLDDNYIPKLTDFGLAKFFSTDKNMITMTAVRGTIGYIAPELINRGFGGVSSKADVYSFGMLLMELVGLNKHMKENSQTSSQYFPSWIYEYFEQGQEIEFEVTDENDNNDTNITFAKKMTIVALWCIQMSSSDRPSMNKVVEMLEAQVECLRVPNRPPQSAEVVVNIEDQSWSTHSLDSTSLLDKEAAPRIKIAVED